jgi:hypothetical protein
MDKRTAAQQRDLVKKVTVLVSIALALLVMVICVADIYLIRRRSALRPTQQAQVAPPATAIPKSIPTQAPPEQFIPADVSTPTPEPVIITAPPTSTWRFLRIDANDIGAFQNVDNPDQRLLAKCIDPGRPPPNKGALYTLDDSGILKLQSGGKKYQRFKVTNDQ